MNKLIYLITGLAITVVFLVLACSGDSTLNIFDRIYYNAEFNYSVYNESLYPMIAAIITVIAWGGAYLYYYIINSVNFDRWYHWAGVLLIVTLLAPVACYFLINGTLSSVGVNLGGSTLQFAIRLLAVTAALFIVASFSMRWWSSNCRHTPIPQ